MTSDPEEPSKQEELAEQVEPSYKSGLFAGLTPNVLRMGWVSFFADVSSEMLYPVMPIFLTAVLHAPVAAVGLIEGVAESVASLLKTVSGRLSDLSGRRRVYVTAGYTVSAIAKPIIALATGWPLVLLARVTDRFGKGVRGSPRDALLADSVSAEQRGRAFGLHRGMDTLGAVIGPLIALAIIKLTHLELRTLFLLAFVPGIVGAAITLLLRERRRPVRPEEASIRYGALPQAFRAYLIGWGAFAIANSSDVFLILKVKSMGDTTALAIGLYVFYNLVYALASPVLGQVSDRMGRKPVLVGGLLVFALVYIGFAAVQHAWQLWPLFCVYGLYTAATDGIGKAFAVDLVPRAIRASAVGLLGTVTGVAALIASSVAGVLWSGVGPWHGLGAWGPFAYGAVGALVASGLILRLRVPATAKPE